MIIKSLQLNNFRQYKGLQKIIFSTDKEKNVTVIKGENGSGKTTLLEAFIWCFYGKLTLPNADRILTADISNSMKNLDKEEVYVEINFIHNEKEYGYVRAVLQSVLLIWNGPSDRKQICESVVPGI